jgi:hypothetical protein
MPRIFEAGGARQERADEAADQERAEDVAEGQFDALPPEQHAPALHRGQDAHELDGCAEREEGPEARGIDALHGVRDQAQRDDAAAVLELHGMGEQQPEDAHREPGLEHAERAALPRLPAEAAQQDGGNGVEEDFEEKQGHGRSEGGAR